MTYIDLAVYAVPTRNKVQWLAHAKLLSPLFIRHGARQLADCWGDDIKDGKTTSLPLAVKCEPDETVAMSVMYWPSKAARDAGMEKVMHEMKSIEGITSMPFDGSRLIFGSFEAALEL